MSGNSFPHLTPEQLSESRQATIYATLIPFYIISLMVVGLRIAGRKLQNTGFWWDDWLIFASTLLLTVQLSASIAATFYGVGLHALTLSKHTTIRYGTALYVLEIDLPILMLLVKLSILFLYIRIFGISSIRIFIYIGMILSVIFAIVTLLVSFLQCIPFPRIFDRTIPGHCIPIVSWFFATSFPNILVDFYILGIPIPYILRLHIRPRQRCFITGLFLLGGFAAIASIVRLWSFLHFPINEDRSWEMTMPMIWNFIEPSVAIISANLASLNGLFKQIRKTWKSSIWGTSSRENSAHSSIPKLNPVKSSGKRGKSSENRMWGRDFYYMDRSLVDGPSEMAVGGERLTPDSIRMQNLSQAAG